MSKTTIFVAAFVVIVCLGVGLAYWFLVREAGRTLDPDAPDTPKCGIENCHGLYIVCGPNVPDACTMEYQIGDNCRQFAKCEVVGGQCTLVVSGEFVECKACVQECEGKHADVPDKLFECESVCADIQD